MQLNHGNHGNSFTFLFLFRIQVKKRHIVIVFRLLRLDFFEEFLVLVDERLRAASFVFHDVLNSLTHDVEIVASLFRETFPELLERFLSLLHSTNSDISRAGGGGDSEHGLS